MNVTCPCCLGRGKVELKEPPPVPMAPLPAQIYRAIKARPGLLGGPQLVDVIYASDPTGGPDEALTAIHVMINRMNKLLAGVGEQVKADRRGAGATYRIVKL